MSSSSSAFEARQLILPKLLHTSTPHLSTLLYDSKSSSLAFRHFDSSFSLYPCVNPLRLSSFPSPQTLILSPTSSATFLHLQTSPDSTTTLFLTCSPILRPSSSTLFRFYVLRDDRFAKIKVSSNHRDLEWDQSKGGMVFNVTHGVSMKLSGGINVFSLYSISNSKIWVFAVRLIGDHGGAEALKLMKCAVIDCCFPIFEIRVLFGFLILGEENGVRVFPLRPLVKGKQRKEKKSGGKRLNLQSGSSNGGRTLATDGELNSLYVKGEKSEKHNDSVKLRFVKLRQDSKDLGSVFMAFEDKDFNDSVSVKMPGKSVKAISIEALSANKFVILDSIGNLHLLCLSSSLQGLDTCCVMKQSTQNMKVLKMAVFHDVSTVTQTIWISDGCYTVHLMAISGMDASVGESEEDTDEKLVKTSVTQAILTSEKIHDIVPMDANAILILGQGEITLDSGHSTDLLVRCSIRAWEHPSFSSGCYLIGFMNNCVARKEFEESCLMALNGVTSDNQWFNEPSLWHELALGCHSTGLYITPSMPVVFCTRLYLLTILPYFLTGVWELERRWLV